MEALFPKDCRTEFARSRRLARVAHGVAIVLFLAALYEMVLGQEEMGPYWVGMVVVLVIGAKFSQCPGCGGASGLFGQSKPRWCFGCGSQLTDEPSSREPHALVTYALDTDPHDARVLLVPLEDSVDRFRFRFPKGCLPWIGLGLLSAAMVLLVLLCPTQVLECRRGTEGRVDGLTYKTLLGWRGPSHPITDIRGAQVQTNQGEEAVSYSVRLDTGSGPVVLHHRAVGSLARHERIAEQLSRYLADPGRVREPFTMRPVWWTWVVAGLLLLVGGALLAQRSPEFSFERVAGRLFILRRGLFTSRLLEYALDNIERFGVACAQVESQDSDSSPGGSGVTLSSGSKRVDRYYGVGMRLKSGAIVYLIDHYFTSGEAGLAKKRATAKWLEDYRRMLVAEQDAPDRLGATLEPDLDPDSG